MYSISNLSTFSRFSFLVLQGQSITLFFANKKKIDTKDKMEHEYGNRVWTTNYILQFLTS